MLGIVGQMKVENAKFQTRAHRICKEFGGTRRGA